jgi:hypothetical protein
VAKTRRKEKSNERHKKNANKNNKNKVNRKRVKHELNSLDFEDPEAGDWLDELEYSDEFDEL